MMKILCVIDSLGSGGSQRQLVSLAVGLAKRGHAVDFFTYHPEINHFEPTLTANAIGVYGYKKSGRWSPRVVLALRSRIRAAGYDGVIAFLTVPALYTEWARLGLNLPKLIVSERASLVHKRGAVADFLAFLSHSLADAVTVNSQHRRSQIDVRYPWIRKRCHTIPNGTDLSAFFPADEPRNPGWPLRLLSVGRVSLLKNPAVLIEALSRLAANNRRVPEVTWVGREDDAFHESVRRLEEQGLGSKWTWLGERSDIAELMRNHDALVHPSLSEGMPNVVCEALASGLPVLAGRIGDHPMLVGDGRRGFLFDPIRPDELAELIQHLDLLDSRSWEDLKSNSRLYAESNLSLDTMVASYEKILLSQIQSVRN